VAVESDYRRARVAIGNGAPVIYGDGGAASVLDVARIEAASLLVVAMPDPLATRQAVIYAARQNRRLHMIARAHSTVDEAELRRMGVAHVITAERQLGNELVRHTLLRYGVSDREIDVILRRRE